MAVLFLGYLIVWPIFEKQYNKSHFTIKSCVVDRAEYVDKGSITAGGGAWLDIYTKNCGNLRMKKTLDGKSLGDLRDYVKPGTTYEVEIGNIQSGTGPTEPQKIEKIKE